MTACCRGRDQIACPFLDGGARVPVTMGAYQSQRLRRVRGQADLIYRDGPFYWAVVAVDLGIVAIAADSDGLTYSVYSTSSLESSAIAGKEAVYTRLSGIRARSGTLSNNLIYRTILAARLAVLFPRAKR